MDDRLGILNGHGLCVLGVFTISVIDSGDDRVRAVVREVVREDERRNRAYRILNVTGSREGRVCGVFVIEIVTVMEWTRALDIREAEINARPFERIGVRSAEI